jgi:hypothetical protein
MPCEVVSLSVDFLKMAVVAMEMATVDIPTKFHEV